MDYLNKNTIKIIESLKNGKLYFNEIYEKTKIKSKNNLLKNLKILTFNKLLIKKANKSNTFYSLNYSNNILISILNLINKNKFEKLPFDIKKSISESIYLLKPKLAILFGSYSKGNYKTQSDIDLLFFNSLKAEEKIEEISKNYGVKLNITSIKLKELNSQNESLIHILKTGYPLVGEDYFYNAEKI